MNKEQHVKKKNDVMTSIMRNPKLSKSFGEAFSSPIGSTKREHAKSVLSIMKKVGGLKNDGMGGPILGGSFNPNQGAISLGQPTTPIPSAPNYSNMLVFPAVPKFKTSVTPGVGSFNNVSSNSPTPYGNDNSNIEGNALKNVNLPSRNYSNSFEPTPIPFNPHTAKWPVTELPKQNVSLLKALYPSNLNEGAKKVIGGITKPILGTAGVIGGTIGALGLSALSLGETAAKNIPTYLRDYNDNEIIGPNQTISGGWANWLMQDSPWMKYLQGMSGTPPVVSPTTPPSAVTPATQTEKTKQYQTYLNDLNKDKQGWVPLEVNGILDEKTKTAQTFGIQPKTNTSGSAANISNTLSNGLSNIIQGGNSVGTQGMYGSAALNIASKLSGANLGLALIDTLKQFGTPTVFAAFVGNEGGSPEGVKNNPGNILFNNLPGQINSGVHPTDNPKATFASYSTPAEGTKAGENLLEAIASGGTSYGANPTLGEVANRWTNTGPNSTGNKSSPGSSMAYGAAQKYLDAGMGSYAFGTDLAKANFGGRSLTQVQIDNTAAYKKALEPLEVQLSNLKAESGNFIPTLTAYMQGKDQYSKAIDSMIQTAKDGLLNVDMSDSASVNEYNNNMAYLQTLKSQQNGRYGAYLNSAISNYNADVTKAQNNYDKFKADAGNLLTQQSTLDQNNYNDIMTRGAALYTELENAPIKNLNLGILQQQYNKNALEALSNGIGGLAINPDHYKDKGVFLKDMAVDNGTTDPLTGTLDWNKLPADGLAGYYTRNMGAGSSETALTETIGEMLNATLKANSNDPKKVLEIKKLITDLGNYSDEGALIASKIKNYTVQNTQEALKAYITTNLSAVKNATKNLVSKSGFFGRGKAGIEDKETWKKNNSSLDSGFLDVLYSSVNDTLGSSPDLANSPSTFLSQLFPGVSDNSDAENLASVISLSR